jgi:hypothetical protein
MSQGTIAVRTQDRTRVVERERGVVASRTDLEVMACRHLSFVQQGWYLCERLSVFNRWSFSNPSKH